jgi:transcriptional regulator with XRE-family HTH domain
MRSGYVYLFGQRLCELREQRGLSQESLADAASLHRTHISLIERGQRSVRLETIERLALALQVQPAELMPAIALPSQRNRRKLDALRRKRRTS